MNNFLKWAYPGQAGVFSNFQGYQQAISSGANSIKSLSYWNQFLPTTMLLSAIGKGVA